MMETTNKKKKYRESTEIRRSLLGWILRIGIASTFVGHGVLVFGIKTSWIKYLTTVGFSTEMAITLMPIIGVIDMTVAAFLLWQPYKIFVIYACLWTLATAVIRPVSGEPIWEFVERGANWTAPLALLILQGWPVFWRDLFR